MKNLIINFALLIALTLVVNTAQAFNNPVDTADVEMVFGSSKQQVITTGAFGEVVGASKSAFFMDLAEEELTPELVRKPRALKKNFTGYTIELVTVFNKPLATDDALFQTFGGIKVVQRTENSFTYMIGNFDNKKALEKYLNQIILPKYAKAHGVKYKKGNIVKYK